MLKYGFYNSVNGDRRYNATDFGQFFDGIISDGAFKNWKTCFDIIPAQNHTIWVYPGKAWANSTYTLLTDALWLMVPEAHSTLYRKDILALVIDEEHRTNSIEIISGTASASPAEVNLGGTSFNGSKIHTYRMASLYIRPNTTYINSGDITRQIGGTGTYDLKYAKLLLPTS